MKKIVSSSMILILIVSFLVGCQTDSKKDYTKYKDTFFNAFDTMITVIGYAETEEEFNSHFKQIESKFLHLHKLYDIYNDYEGINNIKTINDNAGIRPVKVDQRIIDLIVSSKEWYEKTNGQVNIAMGPVLKIWHDYREEGEYDPTTAKLPPMKDLEEAKQYTDINKVVVDTENNTVYLEDEKMRLDVGSVAKGFATEIVSKEIREEGLTSGIISAGGNVRALDKPLDKNKDKWGIGIQNPDEFILPGGKTNQAIVYINNKSVVTSGDYQRYYVVDGERIHHLIDPDTLMPGDYYRSVTILAEDSGDSDALSTAAFLMPYDESKALIDSSDGVEALWIMKDGTVKTTSGMEKVMQSYGADSNI